MSRAQFEPAARAAAREFGIPERGFLALVTMESGWNPNAVSPDGAMGLTQVLPPAIHDSGIPGDPFDPTTNLRQGASYLAWCKRWLHNAGLPSGWPFALAAYNAGIGNVQRSDPSRPGWLTRMPDPAVIPYVLALSPAFVPAGRVSPAAALLIVLALWWALG